MKNWPPAADLPAEMEASWPTSNAAIAELSRKPDSQHFQQELLVLGRRDVFSSNVGEFLRDAAALMASVLDTRTSAVAMRSYGGRTLRVWLSSESDRGDPASVSPREVDAAHDASLAGYALHTGSPVVVRNLAAEYRFSDPLLVGHKIVSAVAVPLLSNGKSFGSLLACDVRARAFDDVDRPFAETIGQLAAATVARIQAEQVAADQLRYASGVLEAVDSLVLTLDSRWRILNINAFAERICGFTLNDLRGRAIGDVFPVSANKTFYQDLLKKLRAGATAVECETTIPTKRLGRRTVRWTFRALDDGHGTLAGIIAAGVDVTEHGHAEERAAKAEQQLRKAEKIVSQLRAKPPDSPITAGTESAVVERAARTSRDRLSAATDAERRQRSRRAYPYRQWVAPMTGGSLPRLDAFTEILCHDIGAGGFSFLSASQPPTDLVVVGLGTPPKVSYLLAEVRHVSEVADRGPRRYLIGCAYVGRAVY